MKAGVGVLAPHESECAVRIERQPVPLVGYVKQSDVGSLAHASELCICKEVWPLADDDRVRCQE